MSNDDLSLADLSANILDDWERWASERPDRETKQDANERKIIALCRAVRQLRRDIDITAEGELERAAERDRALDHVRALEARALAGEAQVRDLVHVLEELERDLRAEVARVRQAHDDRDATQARVRVIEIAARRCLEASSSEVTEAEGMSRLSELARLIGYDAGAVPKVGLPPPSRSMDLDAVSRELTRLADVLAREGEAESPGWRFALFAYQDQAEPQNGHVLAVSRDRDLTLAAVAKWVMERLEQRKTKARG